jgi:hypothetical protein
MFAALGVKEEDMLGVGDVDSILPADDSAEPPATDPVERRRQVEAFMAAAGGDL